ncbi:MAG: 50S ribosomal protein L29 [Candidatus Dadabacteria bacterium]|nr:MAG: 50S ribosomal protein L29 [Candidatus Dadabacteria bacterium]
MRKDEFLNEIRDFDIDALRARNRELKMELMKLRFRKSFDTGFKEGWRLSQLRKDIARVQTVINEKLREGDNKRD